MWLLPFWFSPWIVKIFTNVSIMVPSLSCCTKFLFKWHFQKYQGCILPSIKKIPSSNHIADYAFYRVSLPQSWQNWLFYSSSGKRWSEPSPGLDTLHPDPFLLCKEVSSFVPCLQCPCHLAAHRKGTNSRTSLPKVRYIHFIL